MYVCMRETDFKKLTHALVGAGNSEICSLDVAILSPKVD